MAIFWIKRGIIEPIETARIEKLSLLGSKEWKEVGSIVSERLMEFTGPMVEHWERHHHRSDTYSKNALAMRNAKILKKKLIKNHVTDVTEKVLQDTLQEFSRQPVMLERTTRHNAETPPAFMVKKPKPANFKPGLKDET